MLERFAIAVVFLSIRALLALLHGFCCFMCWLAGESDEANRDDNELDFGADVDCDSLDDSRGQGGDGV